MTERLFLGLLISRKRQQVELSGIRSALVVRDFTPHMTTEELAIQKYLRVAEKFKQPVLEGEKTVTARYDFERDISEGDFVVILLPDDTELGVAVITDKEEMAVREFVKRDFDGHESYESVSEAVLGIRQYYPDADISEDTELVVFNFALLNDEIAETIVPSSRSFF